MGAISYHAGRFRQGIAGGARTLLLLILGAFLFLSLATFDPLDPSFNRAADNAARNAGGIPGAYIADPLLQFFGYAAFLFPIALIFQAFRKERALFLFGREILLLLLVVPAACVFLSLFDASENWPFYTGLGGLTGDTLLKALEAVGAARAALYIIIIPLIPLLFVSCGGRFRKITEIPKAPVRAAAVVQDRNWAGEVVAKVRSSVMRAARAVDRFGADEIKNSPGYKGREDEEDPEGAVRVCLKAGNNIDVALHEPDDHGTGIRKRRAKVSERKRAAKRKGASSGAVARLPGGEGFDLPEMHLLVPPDHSRKAGMSEDALEQNAKILAQVLEDFGVYGKILKARPGPVVTLYELEPSPGTKSSRVIGLADDIARSMSALSARISVVPGRNALGIELPNSEREIVYLREILESKAYDDTKIKLPLALGKDIGGAPIIADLSRMPHLLVAGTTGSGKSVAVNAMILSLLYRLTPEECRFIMIDPKMLELSVYEGIPHLLTPVVTEPQKAVAALKWVVKEMENRYRLMSNLGVRNIAGFNKRIKEAIASGEELVKRVQTGFDPETGGPVYEDMPIEKETAPFIVVIVDEMADLMLTAGKDIEGSIQRLAQMARAAGIHIVMATQRPSVDVITGVIKANFPTRISFQVTSRIDSRTILGDMGAEQLLGMGDMLYMAGGSRITRVHGPFVDDEEVLQVVEHLKSQGEPDYVEAVTEDDGGGMASALGEGGDLYDKAVAVVIRDKRASTSYVQRQLKIGYNRAADLIDRMEKEGVVSAPNHAGKREVLVN